VINGELSAPNLLLVRFRDGATDEDMAEVIAGVGGQIVGSVPLTMLVQAQFDGVWTEARANQLIDLLSLVPIVEGVTLETLLVTTAASCPAGSLCPNDPWSLTGDPPRTLQVDSDFLTGYEWRIEAMRVDRAWGLIYSPGRTIHPVTMGVVELGFGTHSDLSNLQRLLSWASLNPRISDEEKHHGMNVAGIMGADGDNTLGTAGLAWKKHTLLGYVSGWNSSIEDGIDRLSKGGARVINLSIGPGPCSPSPCSNEDLKKKRRKSALQFFNKLYSANKDVLVVQSAGNGENVTPNIDPAVGGFAAAVLWDEGDDLAALRNEYPNLDEIRSRLLVVGGTYPVSENTLERSPESRHGQVVEVWAPGGSNTNCPMNADHRCQILSTGNGSLSQFVGTSQAAPHISGLAGLLWQANPGFTAKQIKNLLLLKQTNGDPISDLEVPLNRIDFGIQADAGGSAKEAIKTIGRPPVASFTDSQLGATFAFDASTSSDPDGDAIDEYNWALFALPYGNLVGFSRGSNSPIWTVPVSPGKYRVTLRVRDANGLESEPVEKNLDKVGPPPPPAISAVAPTTMTANGTPQILTISGSGFRYKNVVQFKWGVGPGAGVWTNSISAIKSLSSSKITVPMNPGLVADTIFVRVCRSSSQTVDSDCSSGTASVTTIPPGGPDLVVQSLTFSPTTVAPGGSAQVSFAITNQGTATAAASTAVVRINQSTTSAAGTDFARISVPAMASGASAITGAKVTTPTTSGIYRVWVIADIDRTAGQSTVAVANDIMLASGTLTVLTNSGTQVALTATPDPVQPGQLVQYTVTVTNRSTGNQVYIVEAQVPNHTTAPTTSIGQGGFCIGIGTHPTASCPAGGTVRWQNFLINAGQSVTLSFAALVSTANPPPNGTIIRSTATATGGSSGASAAVDMAIAP
jgi:hypothetical protein